MANPSIELELLAHAGLKAELFEIRREFGVVPFFDQQLRKVSVEFDQFEETNQNQLNEANQILKGQIENCKTDLPLVGTMTERAALAVSLYLMRFPEGDIVRRATSLSDPMLRFTPNRIQRSVAWLDYYFGFADIDSLIPSTFFMNLADQSTAARVREKSLDITLDLTKVPSSPVKRAMHLASTRMQHQIQSDLLAGDQTGRKLIQAYIDGFTDPSGALGPVRYFSFHTRVHLLRGAQFAQRTYNACYDIAT